jgi:hypothetical protein
MQLQQNSVQVKGEQATGHNTVNTEITLYLLTSLTQ